MDFLFPFVTSEDPAWRDQIQQFAPMFDICRFRDYGTLKYLMRGVEKFMPFIDRIVMLVAMDSQVPSWVNRKTVRVVTHDEIIPDGVLPTFNSSVIECFFNNIPDLSEKFIYSNDDMFPVGPMTEECFFKDGKPIINYKEMTVYNTSFLRMIKHTNDISARLAGVKAGAWFVKPAHFHAPMLKSVNLEIARRARADIRKSISRFRTSENINQYLYQDYYIYAGLSTSIPFAYNAKRIAFDHPSKAKTIAHDITCGRYQIYCINDEYHSNNNFEYAMKTIRAAFEQILPEKSKWEV